MLEEILMHLHNWFVVPNGVHTGKYSIKDGSIALPFLVPGQYFRIVGSVFNDGVYKYLTDGPIEGLVDEDFAGEIWAMAVPKALIKLTGEIEEWVKKHPDTVYVSESFGGYSRTLSTNGATGTPSTWRDVFQGHLNAWRKIA